MRIQILYYTRKDFGGWRRYTWLPVQWAQGKFVHCEILICDRDRILNASNVEGVVLDEMGPFTPSGRHGMDVDKDAFESAISTVLGQSYSWGGFFRLLWPRWGSDPKGMICSELVAYILRQSASEEYYKAPFIAVPPHRWTPNQVFSALENLMYWRGDE